MGQRGVLKVPSHLRPVADGASAGSAAETTPRLAPRKPPSVADNAELSELWDEIVPGLDETGLIAPSDGPTVEVMLRALSLTRRAWDQIGDEVVVADPAHVGVKKNPAEAVFRAEADLFMRLAQQCGMTFVSRARTPAAKGRDDDENPFASAASGG